MDICHTPEHSMRKPMPPRQIKRIQLVMGWTVREMAEALGRDRTMAYKWLRGDYPIDETAEKLLRCLSGKGRAA